MRNTNMMIASAFLALQMVFASVAGAMTVKEFKSLDGDAQDTVLTRLISDQLKKRTEANPAQGQCLDDQFYKVSTNTLGVPDGPLFVSVQIQKSYEKDPNGRQVEDVVKYAMNYIAKTACSATEQAKTPEGNKKDVASNHTSGEMQLAKK